MYDNSRNEPAVYYFYMYIYVKTPSYMYIRLYMYTTVNIRKKEQHVQVGYIHVHSTCTAHYTDNLVFIEIGDNRIILFPVFSLHKLQNTMKILSMLQDRSVVQVHVHMGGDITSSHHIGDAPANISNVHCRCTCKRPSEKASMAVAVHTCLFTLAPPPPPPAVGHT